MSIGGYLRSAVIHWKPQLAVQVLIALPLAGCGSDLAAVDGTVTLDGQNATGAPDVQGTVVFSPAKRGGGLASGILDKSGHYSLSVGTTGGLSPGQYLVAISIIKIIPPATPGGTPGGQLISPRIYTNPQNSGLEAQVGPGANTIDFSLQSKQSTSKTQ